MALPRSLWFLLAATGCAAYTAFDDASFAIMTRNISDVLGAHKKEFYDSYLEGCRTAAKAKAASQCDSEDDWRMHMNMYQTASVYNYTELGFAKIRLPEDLFADILKFWERNKDQSIVEWTRTTAYHNNWEHETTVVRMENASLPGGGPPLTSSKWSQRPDVARRRRSRPSHAPPPRRDFQYGTQCTGRVDGSAIGGGFGLRNSILPRGCCFVASRRPHAPHHLVHYQRRSGCRRGLGSGGIRSHGCCTQYIDGSW